MKLVLALTLLLLFSAPVWAQDVQSAERDVHVQSAMSKPQAPQQPSLTDQMYMIARAQEKQIEILQQELIKTQNELNTLKNPAPK